MLITEILSRNARIYGPEVALIEREPAKNSRTEMTWQTFDDHANSIAQALVDRGVVKGDRVVLLLMNCLEWLPTYFGILRTGGWAVPLNFRFVAKTIYNCTKLAEPRVFIFGEEFIDRIDEIRYDIQGYVKSFIFAGPEDKCPEWAESLPKLIKEYPPENPQVPCEISDDAALYFTSGTTGTPKAVRLTHRNLEHACYIENLHHHQTREDVFLCIPPLYHTGAKMHWFGSFIVGGKAVILKGIEPEWIFQAISEEQATIVWLLVPWALDMLFAVESGELKLKNYQLDQWRLMHIGAQPVPASLIREWNKIFPHHKYDTNYGLTESTGPGCIHLGIENMHKVGSIGVPGFDWEFQIVDEHLRPVPYGFPGELIVKGPGMMKEYYKNPEETEKTLINGWLMTGDIARQDEDGFLWLVDRKKDVIITGGENIYPVEIEAFIMGHPSVQDVAIIGTPSLRLGEISTAIIKVKPGHELEVAQINVFCGDLPRYKRPRKVIFADVPRNATGKIEKPELRKIYAGHSESFKV